MLQFDQISILSSDGISCISFYSVDSGDVANAETVIFHFYQHVIHFERLHTFAALKRFLGTMQILKVAFLLLWLCFCLVKAEEDTVGNANDYVDEVLRNLRKEPWIISKIDPLDIPEVNEKNFELKEGKIRGLSSLYRHGDCTLDYDGEIVKVSAQVAVKDVFVELKYAAKALFFWIKGHADVAVDDLAVRMDISGKDGKAKLDSFKVIHLGKYKIKKITGLSVVLNWLYKLIANAVAKNSRNKIIKAMEEGVAKAVGDLLEKYQLPKLANF
ncbi:uncharacterized protein TNCT_133351 [Trichonephila clavata]|uniref:Uncharacterized protein n=1 Tax=Trichonephila clavata TaxID=2740835 RepID=A0A8X6LCY5_TRICU|nr:uncharacterized protein TNCT_133351 [Trichonephila clavata]